MAFCPVFGPKMSVFCMLVSVWGVVQLGLMGVFFYVRSVALIEDIAIPEESVKSPQTFLSEVNFRYDNSAKNCFVAACLYVVTMVFSIWQYLANRRVTAQPPAPPPAAAEVPQYSRRRSVYPGVQLSNDEIQARMGDAGINALWRRREHRSAIRRRRPQTVGRRRRVSSAEEHWWSLGETTAAEQRQESTVNNGDDPRPHGS